MFFFVDDELFNLCVHKQNMFSKTKTADLFCFVFDFRFPLCMSSLNCICRFCFSI
jgi:hypothetical protein